MPFTLLRLRAEHPDESSEELARTALGTCGQSGSSRRIATEARAAPRLQFVDLLIAEIGRGLDDPTPERIEEELIALDLHEYVRDSLPSDS